MDEIWYGARSLSKLTSYSRSFIPREEKYFYICFYVCPLFNGRTRASFPEVKWKDSETDGG
jgi:hypothetical protein